MFVAGGGEERDDDPHIRRRLPERGDDRLCLLELSHRGRMKPHPFPRWEGCGARRQVLEEPPPSGDSSPHLGIRKGENMKHRPEEGDDDHAVENLPEWAHVFRQDEMIAEAAAM